MKTQVRILPGGNLNSYVRKGGSWDEAQPDEASFLTDIYNVPTVGDTVVFKNPNDNDALYIGPVASVVVTAAMTYLFIPNTNKV